MSFFIQDLSESFGHASERVSKIKWNSSIRWISNAVERFCERNNKMVQCYNTMCTNGDSLPNRKRCQYIYYICILYKLTFRHQWRILLQLYLFIGINFVANQSKYSCSARKCGIDIPVKYILQKTNIRKCFFATM